MATLQRALGFLLAAAAFGVALSAMPPVLRAGRAGVPAWCPWQHLRQPRAPCCDDLRSVKLS